VFSKTEYWDQLPSLSSESNAKSATARFLRRGFPYGFSRGIPCSAYTTKYPIPAALALALTAREEYDEHAGDYRENEEGEDRDPLHDASRRAVIKKNAHQRMVNLCRQEPE
jgi:hypothetical protein